MSSFLFGIIYKVCTGAIHLPTDSVTYEQDDRLWCKAHRHKRYIAWPESEFVLSWWIHNCTTLCRATRGIGEGAVIRCILDNFWQGVKEIVKLRLGFYVWGIPPSQLDYMIFMILSWKRRRQVHSKHCYLVPVPRIFAMARQPFPA